MTDAVAVKPVEWLGWKPDIPDRRDRKFAFRTALAHEMLTPAELPVRAMAKWRRPGVDTTADQYPVFDQGPVGSCTGNAGATFFGLISGLVPRSRLHLYYEARRLIGETKIDGGAYIRDVFKVLTTLGTGRESWWPYDVNKVFDDPPTKEDTDAAKHLLKTYNRLDTGDADTGQMFRSCIAAGYPFEIGFAVYSAFMTTAMERTGVLLLPLGNEQDEGGHAVCVIGYDRNWKASPRAAELRAGGMPESHIPDDVYIVRNSWGADWGWNGNFVVDAKYFEDSYLADDAWTGRLK
jgi:C1A family cysteine protease